MTQVTTPHHDPQPRPHRAPGSIRPLDANARRLAKATVGPGSEPGPGRDPGSREIKPRVDGFYRQAAGEFLAACPLDGDESFAAELAKRFREGPTRACSRTIGDWITRRMAERSWTQQNLADRVGVDRSAVARWTAGEPISLGHLVVVLIRFQAEVVDLPWPTCHQLAVEGYISAMNFVMDRLNPGHPTKSLYVEEFWCLYHLLAEPTWGRAIRREDGGLLRSEADRVLSMAAASLGRSPSRIKGVEDLRSMVDAWTPTWIICLEYLPRNRR